ncbi:hypothetical protein ACLEPN_13610 [Myxococcus sp. 1LA]
MKSTLGALWTVVLLAGCGGPTSEVDAADNLATREDALPFCGNSEYSLIYYSDATHSVAVGYEVCMCFSPMWRRGPTTPFVEVLFENGCPERPAAPLQGSDAHSMNYDSELPRRKPRAFIFL